jgi:hypothetical protein
MNDTIYYALDEAASDNELGNPIYITFGNAGELLLD